MIMVIMVGDLGPVFKFRFSDNNLVIFFCLAVKFYSAANIDPGIFLARDTFGLMVMFGPATNFGPTSFVGPMILF